MKKIDIDDDMFLNEKYKIKLFKGKTLRKRKRKIKIKFSIHIFIILIITTTLFILYLIFNKGKEDEIRFNMINEQSKTIINRKNISYSNRKKKAKNYNKTNSPLIEKDLDEEYKDIQEYIYMVKNGTLYNPNEVFKKSENPKISIVISVYNGEGYLKDALLSIENQDFKDIEIIMVDDCSKDNSVNLIKELMVRDSRIILIQNEENKGALFTKTKGVLNAKGKYVMTLDIDDIYVQRDAFSTLYSEAEINNLDILGFALLDSEIHLKKGQYIHRYIETDVIYQPNIPKRMHDCNSTNCKRVGDYISNYFFRTEFYIDTIKQIDDKYMNVKMICHDDFLLFFLLTRKAHSLRQIKRIFYIKIERSGEINEKVQFSINEKNKDKPNLKCLAYLNYEEFILDKTNNDIKDKKIASFELKDSFLNNYCRHNTFVRERAINVLELFLKNNYIETEIKNEINAFFKEINYNTKNFPQ